MNYRILILLLGLSSVSLFAQEGRKLWLSSYSRGVIYSDDFSTQGQNDTVTARKTQSGHALVDLGLHVAPNENLEVHGMLRVRNDFGGFWGSGVTFDLRQLWVRGVIGDILRYQLGDIDYRMTPYTFRNEDEWILSGTSTVTETSLDMLRYDIFQGDQETWRQQGVALDFGFQFKRYVDAIDLSMFATRVNSADQGGHDRIYGGGMADLQLLKDWRLRYHYANLFDIAETSTEPVTLVNPVQSVGLNWAKPFGDWSLFAEMEAGISRLEWQGDDMAPVLEDGFSDFSGGFFHRPSRVKVRLGWRQVGANFRSAGAQTKRIRFERAPQAYQRYTNDQILRGLSTYDLLRDGTLYNTQLEAGLMQFDPKYGNALPYGLATPNRRGVTARVDWTSTNDAINLGGRFSMLNDIAGQGTDQLRTFNLMQVDGSLHLDKYFGWERKLELSALWSMEATSRDGDPAFETSDLTNNLINIFAEWEFYDMLSLLAEFRTYSSSGRDQYARRNEYSEVIDFVEVNHDANEALLGGGLQYRFDEKIAVQLFYQRFQWEDTALDLPAYDWDNWQFNFIMTL